MKSAGKYEKLGEEVARELGPGPVPERRARQKSAFLALSRASHPMFAKRRPRLLAAAGLATLLIAVVVFFMLQALQPAAPLFWVGTERQAGKLGEWIKADELAPVPLHFTDGTRMELQKNSAGRVFSRDKQVRIELGQGRVVARIDRQKTKSRWTVEAGEFRVTALGTVFSVSRDEANALEVRVFQGQVEVRGPGFSQEGIRLNQGERLVIGKDQKPAIARLTPQKPPPPPPAEEPEVVEDPPPVASLPPPKPEKPPVTPPDQPSLKEVASMDQVEPKEPGWKEHFKQRDYAQAVTQAEKLGLASLYQTLSDADLMQLSNAARFAGKKEVAIEALLALRKRFRDSWYTDVAAFLLGRLALEVDQDSRKACNWFMIYLKESPNGRLSKEALGRSISTCSDAGQDTLARQAARDYLDRYPTGSLAENARKLLADQGDPLQ